MYNRIPQGNKVTRTALTKRVTLLPIVTLIVSPKSKYFRNRNYITRF